MAWREAVVGGGGVADGLACEGGPEVVAAAVLALPVAGHVEEPVGAVSAVGAGEAVVGFECGAVEVAGGVAVHRSVAPPAVRAVAMVRDEASADLLVLPAEAACRRGLQGRAPLRVLRRREPQRLARGARVGGWSNSPPTRLA